MEDIINALLDVVRAQHTATEGTDEAPFNMDDIVDMAMNLLGRPDEKEEEESLVDTIQKTVESLAPDLFPAKTFEQMDDSEKVLSASSMIENAFMRNNGSANSAANSSVSDRSQAAVNPTSSYNGTNTTDSYSAYPQEEEETTDPGELNDLIYKNFMQMMGLSTPQVEYPFDRSQVVYGKEKSVTEMLAEEEEEKERAAREESERNRKLSAWELAQNAIDADEAIHEKEPFIPTPIEEPVTKSASQMAAEAIRQAEERDRMQLEIEKQAEAMMAEARKRGQDPMKFMLHQQEILRYMEKNSDELVSFEDYEDLSPEEKLEIERQIHIEHQIADGVDPDQVDQNVPEEYIPEELKPKTVPDAQANAAVDSPDTASSNGVPSAEESFSTFDEDTLRALSQQVLSENSDLILSENANEDMAGLQEELFQNLKRMMAGSGTAVPQENVASLLSQAAANQMAAYEDESASPASTEVSASDATAGHGGSSRSHEDADEDEGHGRSNKISAAELAAQRLAREPKQEVKETLSAVELARAAQMAAKPETKPAEEEMAAETEELDLSFDELDQLFDEDTETPEDKAEKAASSSEEQDEQSEIMTDEQEEDSSALDKQVTNDTASADSDTEASEDRFEAVDSEESEADDDEYEYVDPDELVLGDHTQAEIDEAMDNLASLGLEGEVYERAKRMILLELAGSEPALEAWLYEQENSKKKKANRSALDEEKLDDLSDFDEDLFEKELEMAMEEDFDDEMSDAVEADADAGLEGMEEAEPEAVESEAIESEAVESEAVESETSDSETSDSEEGQADQPVEIEVVDSAVDNLQEAEIGGEEAGMVDETAEEMLEDLSEVAEEKAPLNDKKTKSHRSMKSRKNVVRKKERSSDRKASQKEAEQDLSREAEERGYQVSVRKPFVLKNSTSFMDKFEDFITENQENRRLSTGFRKLDGLLRFGLHKGSYFIDARPQYLKNAFMQQMADRAAESGVDVLYISTELSRYDLMVDTISRLSYEMNGHDAEKAHSVMSIMTGEDGATLDQLADQLNWYRGRISEHLFILDQEAVDEFVDGMDEEVSAGAILEELIRSIVTEGTHKPVVFIDNIENILSVEDSEDMKPLMDGIRQLAKELSIPIVMSYGYAQAESEEELSVEEQEFHESIGNMCDVYLELQYADMITEDSVELTEEDIREMVEDGDSLLIDVMIYRNRRPMRASCQIQATPKYNFFEE